MRALRYWHTLRHLKAAQIVGRVRFRLSRPAPDLAPPPALRHAAGWVAPAEARSSMLAPDRVRFLNVERSLASADWEPADADKLWVYNLHYFGDLTAARAAERTDWHRALMLRWVRENPPGQGTGWEPYPASLRIVNWVKWALSGNELPEPCVHSLAVQARWLARRLEWHLLGNHLFVNAKALVFAGLFFDAQRGTTAGTTRPGEADEWLHLGARILGAQIPEQVLADGGQFERSPMYHALALEDMLDLCNALRAYSGALAGDAAATAAALLAQVTERIGPMRHWLAVMSHPDGGVSFFNDAAFGIAPDTHELDAYARRLGFPAAAPLADGMTHLAASGYVRMQRGAAVALLDVAPVGPDYIPGHAHADTLSCELSVHGTRVLVNSGTSVYGTGAERLRQRGTAAHNTVVVNGADSSEVWGGFRVARRARPFDFVAREAPGGMTVACSHDGYRRLPGAPVHRREWVLTDGALTVTDTVGNTRTAHARWHFAPGIAVTGGGPFECALPGGQRVQVAVSDARSECMPSSYHPEFGVSTPATLLDCQFTGAMCVARFSWS